MITSQETCQLLALVSNSSGIEEMKRWLIIGIHPFILSFDPLMSLSGFFFTEIQRLSAFSYFVRRMSHGNQNGNCYF